MFYEIDKRDRTLLPHDPVKAIIAPRPIGWISTVGTDGSVNLAPYSFFNQISSQPPMLMFSSDGPKHSATNAEATGEFVYNLATYELRQAMSATSAPLPKGVSEFDAAGLTPAACRLVKPPRVLESPASLECKVVAVLRPPDLTGKPIDNIVVIGQIVGVHIDEAYVVDGMFDIVKAGTITRAGYADYVRVESVFAMLRPKGGGGRDGAGR